MLSSSANFSLSWAIFCSFRFQRKEGDGFKPAHTKTWICSSFRCILVCERKRVRESHQSLAKLKSNTHALHFHTRLQRSTDCRSHASAAETGRRGWLWWNISHTPEHVNVWSDRGRTHNLTSIHYKERKTSQETATQHSDYWFSLININHLN